jgi:hypothetical protein
VAEHPVVEGISLPALRPCSAGAAGKTPVFGAAYQVFPSFSPRPTCFHCMTIHGEQAGATGRLPWLESPYCPS